MRMTATALIFLFGLLAIIAGYLSHSLVILQRVVYVDRVVGRAEVFVHGRGAPVPLQAGKLVREGDVVRTGPDSSVELRWLKWAGGMRTKIGPQTRFRVKRAVVNRSTKDEESRLRVDIGKVWVRLRKALRGRSKFEVETPTVVAAVRGTVFSVSVGPGGVSEVEVYEGRVAVEGPRGAAATLGRGSQTTAGKGQRTLQIHPMTPEDLAQWTAESCIIGPFLEVSAPAEGEAVEGDSVSVVGRAEPEVRVLVNDQQAKVSTTGEFSAEARLEPEANTVTVTARDDAGRETTIIRGVSRVPAAGGS